MPHPSMQCAPIPVSALVMQYIQRCMKGGSGHGQETNPHPHPVATQPRFQHWAQHICAHTTCIYYTVYEASTLTLQRRIASPVALETASAGVEHLQTFDLAPPSKQRERVFITKGWRGGGSVVWTWGGGLVLAIAIAASNTVTLR